MSLEELEQKLKEFDLESHTTWKEYVNKCNQANEFLSNSLNLKGNYFKSNNTYIYVTKCYIDSRRIIILEGLKFYYNISSYIDDTAAYWDMHGQLNIALIDLFNNKITSITKEEFNQAFNSMLESIKKEHYEFLE